jgi:hypothetical protein
MRRTGIAVASLITSASFALMPFAVHAATELDGLREELQKTQAAFQQLLEMQQETQRKMDALQQKLDAMEATRGGAAPAGAPVAAPGQQSPPPTAATQGAAPTQATAQAPPPTTPGGGLPSMRELVQPREPFALYKERGQGQLLFDMGVVGDFVGDVTSTRVEKAQAGTFPGFENRFFPREVELGFFGQIDPYARGVVLVEAGESFDTATGERKVNLELAEAHLTLQTLPFGTQLKLGQVRPRFGLSNEIHEHDLPQTDRPDVMRRFLTDEGLKEKGAELSWVAPVPFYLESLVGVFNGDTDTVSGFGRLRAPLVTARVRSFLETDEYGAVQFGVSGASGETPAERRTALLGVDLKYKYTPASWHHPLLTVAGEGLYFNQKIVTADGDPRTQQRWGMYTYAELQPWTRWAGGLRFDWTQFPNAGGHEWGLEPYVTFLPSEFLRFRLGYKYTNYSGDSPLGKTIANEVLLQASFILGAHPAHPF